MEKRSEKIQRRRDVMNLRRKLALDADFASHSSRRMKGATAMELNSFSVRPKAPAIKCVHSEGFSVNLAPSLVKTWKG